MKDYENPRNLITEEIISALIERLKEGEFFYEKGNLKYTVTIERGSEKITIQDLDNDKSYVISIDGEILESYDGDDPEQIPSVGVIEHLVEEILSLDQSKTDQTEEKWRN